MSFAAISEIQQLRRISRDIRRSVIKSLAESGSGHLGGPMGLADIFTCLYFNILRHDPADPEMQDRDRLILSIGHVAPILYATLAHAGYFPKEELMTLRKLGSRLQGHPGREHGLPGIELSAGSLGQGLSVAVGRALSGKIDQASWNVWCILGDGELQEGSVWEAIMAASHHKLDHLVAVVDRNGLQIDGPTEKVMALEPLKQKWESFGWYAIECDGNGHAEFLEAARLAVSHRGKPAVILAKTIMGKGIPSVEGDYRWHGKVPSPEEAEDFIRQLEATS